LYPGATGPGFSHGSSRVRLVCGPSARGASCGGAPPVWAPPSGLCGSVAGGPAGGSKGERCEERRRKRGQEALPARVAKQVPGGVARGGSCKAGAWRDDSTTCSAKRRRAEKGRRQRIKEGKATCNAPRKAGRKIGDRAGAPEQGGAALGRAWRSSAGCAWAAPGQASAGLGRPRPVARRQGQLGGARSALLAQPRRGLRSC
jgi:hypothetical protein